MQTASPQVPLFFYFFSSLCTINLLKQDNKTIHKKILCRSHRKPWQENKQNWQHDVNSLKAMLYLQEGCECLTLKKFHFTTKHLPVLVLGSVSFFMTQKKSWADSPPSSCLPSVWNQKLLPPHHLLPCVLSHVCSSPWDKHLLVC